jgi:octaprenyl-diphosphate synthase
MESTRAAAGAEARRAIQALDALPASTYRDALWALAEQLLDRRS